VIDAHVHFWDTDLHTYEWLAEAPGLVDRYVLADYREATADDPPEGFMFVQAGCTDADGAAEARWVDQMCGDQPDFAGMVVWAPVDGGADAVDSHLDALDRGTVRGVRRLLQSDPPGLCTQPRFVEGVSALGRRDLTFDVCILPRHLDDAVALARGAPSTRLVLDHLAKPDIAAGDLDGWWAGFAALGRCDNVCCKLSGLVTEADHVGWTVDDLRPYVEGALDVFGAERLLWGSDWPVVTGAASHRRWRAATAELLAELSAAERAAILHQTATDVYRLNGDLQ